MMAFHQEPQRADFLRREVFALTGRECDHGERKLLMDLDTVVIGAPGCTYTP